MEWQPIATAPKDGTSVLLWSRNGYDVAVWSGRIGEWTTGQLFYAPEPTHWMPLPSPPVQKREGT